MDENAFENDLVDENAFENDLVDENAFENDLVDENDLKMILYRKLAFAEILFTDETKTEAQSTKVKVTLDKTVSS